MTTPAYKTLALARLLALALAIAFAGCDGSGIIRENLLKEYETYAPDFDKKTPAWETTVAAADERTAALPEGRPEAATTHVDVKSAKEEISEACMRWSRLAKDLHDEPRLDATKKKCEDLLGEATRAEKALRLKLDESE